MEVLPCSGAQYVGESECPQQGSGTSFTYDAESSCLQDRKQVEVEDGSRLDNLLVDGECHYSASSLPDDQSEGRKLSSGFHDEDADMSTQKSSAEPGLASENSRQIVDTIECELPGCNREGESSLSEPTWLQHDESVALWVKWRGMWQAGIRCARADWPLSTLKAKPTHDRKKYSVVYFPHTRNYSWADTLLVRPINEYPQPIAYRSHYVGLKMVKDLSVARRFIMQKLAVGMLNIIDQFHTDALVETARDVMVWREFAMEASRCGGYSELGRMLVKLQNMILLRYINSDWLEQSFNSWAERCQIANSAESIEMLKEELYDSVLFNEVNSLWDAPVQPTLGSEWKTWKHEVMKWFSTSHPTPTGGNMDQQSTDGPSIPISQVSSRKRPKLEIRRAEPHTSHAPTKDSNQAQTVELGSQIFNSHDVVNATAVAMEFCEGKDNGSVADRWDGIVVEAGNSELAQSRDVESTPLSKNRRCVAFIEAKGRQCVRWANEGDVYCCVHLSSRFLASSSRARAEVTSPADTTPMCGGTTVLGTRCKHRSLLGSSFCKKHRPQKDGKNNNFNFSENVNKRKHDEIIACSETTPGKEIVPVSMVDDGFEEKVSLTGGLGNSGEDHDRTGTLHCIGSSPNDITSLCREIPNRHTLYCDHHLPSWLKRARNGKTRIISKEVFMDLLRGCRPLEQKLHLHLACELFYRFFKSVSSLRNPVPMEVQLQWALSEASKNPGVGELLLKLVSTEKERLGKIWGFGSGDGAPVEESAMLPYENDKTIKCKHCTREFLDDQTLGAHWMDSHKKEAQWLFRGYACAICLDSFTNKKVLETHVQERHHAQFVEQCMLLQCILCGGNFGNIDDLWSHVLSVHPNDIRVSGVSQQNNAVSVAEDSPMKVEQGSTSYTQNDSRRFLCKLCGLKFDLLPDLGRHHQAAHMGANLSSPRPKGVRYYAYKLKSGRLTRPRFKNGLTSAAYRIRNRNNAGLKKHINIAKSLGAGRVEARTHSDEALGLGKLVESQCSTIAKIMYSEIQRIKPRPSNLDILSVARSCCCKFSLAASLESRYGEQPERLYLKAAKICSEHNVQVNWHKDGFVCSNGCKPLEKNLHSTPPSVPFPIPQVGNDSDHAHDELEMDESHYIINSHHCGQKSTRKSIVLCDDISFGQESVPIPCVVDECMLGSVRVAEDGSMPWESFTYIMKPLLDQNLDLDTESLQLGCACQNSTCRPEACDHVYLFDNDYEDAKDIYGKPMHGRFPYDENSRIVLEEGYLVYECNHTCSCSRTCPNRVLQNGVQVKLEVHRTENKGWAVRAGEAIPRGTFVCEYIGEVVDDQESIRRHNRYGECCSFMYSIDAQINDMSRLVEGHVQYAIDATKYGNVSRFLNHSCSPNLVNHQVLVESMDCHRAHIGLYASRDIALGEELSYDYRYKTSPGEGLPCQCEAPNCRGRLH